MNKLKNNAWFRKVGMALLDIVLILLSVYLSMELRFEMYIPTRHAQTMFSAMPLVVAVYMACYVFGGIYQIMWRYAGVRDVARLCLLSAIACGVTLALNQFLALGLFRGVLILIALMATIAVGGSRMIWRVCSKDRIAGSLDDAMPVMIVGAGAFFYYAFGASRLLNMRLALKLRDPVYIAVGIVGLLVLGKVFALTTAISSFYYPAILAVFQSLFGEVRLTEDPLLATVLAGLMIGAGIGVVIRAGASTGGMDIPPLVLQKKLRIPVSVSLYVFDCLILLLQALFSNVEQVLYGLVMVLLYTLTLNKTLLLGTGQMQLKVVSKKYGEISQAIQRQVDRGTTLFQSMGGFEQEQGCTVLTVVDRRELPKLTELVTEIDPDAFMVVNQVNEVRGRGFTSPKRYEKRDT